jgi:hypothetical protein
MDQIDLYTAFDGDRRVASGDLRQVLQQTAAWARRDDLRIFDNATGGLVETDPRQPPAPPADETPPAMDSEARRGPGRPKLGVVAREVTLLPRHWQWLAAQPGGASVALRKLVETARKADDSQTRARRAQDAADRFMHAMAGDRSGDEEALRTL